MFNWRKFFVVIGCHLIIVTFVLGISGTPMNIPITVGFAILSAALIADKKETKE